MPPTRIGSLPPRDMGPGGSEGREGGRVGPLGCPRVWAKLWRFGLVEEQNQFLQRSSEVVEGRRKERVAVGSQSRAQEAAFGLVALSARAMVIFKLRSIQKDEWACSRGGEQRGLAGHLAALVFSCSPGRRASREIMTGRKEEESRGN